MKGLIYKGRVVTVPYLQVHDGRAAGMWFDPGDPNTRNRQTKPDLAVWHHQAGEGGAQSLYRVLEKRGLSVHFEIDDDGLITQLADLATTCAHAGIVNERSVGIEMANLGRAKMTRRIRNYFHRLGYRRDVYEDRVHGRKLKFFRFLPAQVGAAFDLYRALSEVLEIPQAWPMSLTGQVVRTKTDLANFTGHCGHLHVTDHKIGPSPHLMDELAARASIRA